MLLELLALGEAGGVRRHDEGGVALGADVGVDDGDDDVDVGYAAVGRPGLGAVEDPLVLGLVVDGAGAHRGHVGAGVGLGGAEGGDLHVVGVAVHLRDPGADLLLGAVGEDADGRQARTDDRQADARVAPEQLLHDHGDAEPGGVEELLGVEVQGVDADLRGLLDDGPGRFLTLVPLGGGGADHVRGEAVEPLLDLLLVVVELKRELGHVSPPGTAAEKRALLAVTTVCYRQVATVNRPGADPASSARGVTLRGRAGAMRRHRVARGGRRRHGDRTKRRATADRGREPPPRVAGSGGPGGAQGRSACLDERHRRRGRDHQAHPLPPFRGQGGLYRALATRHTDALLSALRAALDAPADRRRRVESTLDTYLAAIEARPRSTAS